MWSKPLSVTQCYSNSFIPQMISVIDPGAGACPIG